MRPKSAVLAVTVAVCVLALACTAEQRAMLGHLRGVQKAIAAQFPEGDANVALINDRYLTVRLTNSRLNGVDETTREREARRIAATAASAIEQPVERVSVTMIKHRGAFGFHYNATVATYSYTPAELAR